MKHVELTRTFPPWQAGDRRIFTDEIADRLVADGRGRIIPSVFDRAREPGQAGHYETRVVTPASSAEYPVRRGRGRPRKVQPT
jgi:hypothetical protein